MRRFLALASSSIAWLALLATPASAHGGAGLVSSNYRTEVKSVSPEVSGLAVRGIEAGSRIEVENRSQKEVVILGYGSGGQNPEPYLRIGPDGVFQNTRSPSVYLNTSRTPGAPPPQADPKAKPEWEKISAEPVARWHDHRTHWMGANDPPVVQREPGKRHTIISDWKIQMRYDNREILATGDLFWIPGPSPNAWYAISLALIAGIASLALRPQWERLIAAVLVGLVVVDFATTTGFLLASVGTSLGGLIGSAVPSLLSAGFALFGASWLMKGKEEGLYIGLAPALFVAVFGGVTELGVFSSSQVPFAFGSAAARLFVALSLGLGIGLVAAAGVLFSRGGIGMGADREKRPIDA